VRIECFGGIVSTLGSEAWEWFQPPKFGWQQQLQQGMLWRSKQGRCSIYSVARKAIQLISIGICQEIIRDVCESCLFTSASYALPLRTIFALSLKQAGPPDFSLQQCLGIGQQRHRLLRGCPSTCFFLEPLVVVLRINQE